jgi:phosphate butyryltransferase
MPLAGFDELFEQADARRPCVPLAVAGAADRTVVEAMRQARDRGWAAPRLVGREADIRKAAAGISLAGLALVDAEDAAAAAVAQVRAGQARLLMKGQVATPTLLKAVLDPEHGLRTGRVICQVVLMEIRPTGRKFLLADTGICIRPTLAQKEDILRSAASAARALGAAQPRVAVLAATEAVTEAMPETVEAAELQRQGEQGEFADCLVQGPLSFDLAYSADAAGKKRMVGAVAGAADVLLFPDLTSANLTVKAIMYTADSRFGGVLCGAACPILFMSRADTAATRLQSLALALALGTLTSPCTPHPPSASCP